MKEPRKRDENEDAADVVRRSTSEADDQPDGLEAAWADWSRRIQGVDERTMTLLRAAFEAGAEAGPKARSRAGGLRGGAARAAALSPARRRKIAKAAAAKRWGARPKPK